METPEEWTSVGSSRIIIIRDYKAVKLAEFYHLYDGVWLPAEDNAAFVVRAVTFARANEDAMKEAFGE